MKQVISLYLPTWPTDRLRRALGNRAPAADVPLVLVGREGRRRVVLAANRVAQGLGIRLRMPATQATALVADLRIESVDFIADIEGLSRLAQWALKRYSPVVSPDVPDGLFLDATGVPHLFGGEAAMMRDIMERLKNMGIEARAAMAPTYGAAHALARYGASSTISVTKDKLESALDRLPVAALRLPLHIIAGLHDLGFALIGQVRRQPRAPLTRRFGPDICLRLDQAFGYRAEPIAPSAPHEALTVSRNFAEPIGTPESLRGCIALLVEEISQCLTEKAAGARRLDLLFHRVDNRIEAIRIGLTQPTREPKVLTRLLREKLEKVDPGFGIEKVTLWATWTEAMVWKQSAAVFSDITMSENKAPMSELASLIDTLSNRIGPKCLYRMVPVESDVPERSAGRIPPLSPPRSLPHVTTMAPRPVRLLYRPESIETMALLPDHPPVSFTWRDKQHRVRSADGPERLFGEWWKRDEELQAVRDYFRVETENGERFWIFRSGNGIHSTTGSQRWFLHGFFA